MTLAPQPVRFHPDIVSQPQPVAVLPDGLKLLYLLGGRAFGDLREFFGQGRDGGPLPLSPLSSSALSLAASAAARRIEPAVFA